MARCQFILYLLASSFLLSSPAFSQLMEANTERAGATYAKSAAGAAGPRQCWSACASDNRCKAWTWERPGIKEPSGVCSLKSSVMPAQTSPCCISGIAQKLEQQIELGLGGQPRNTSYGYGNNSRSPFARPANRRFDE